MYVCHMFYKCQNDMIFSCAQFKKHEEVAGEEKVPYSYGLFHFVFAVGAMYLAMLFVGWNLHQTMHR